MTNKKLIELACENLKNSYAPYSNFPVSVAILSDTDTVYLGVNVENVSYGATICAERSAIVAAVSDGVKKGGIKKIVIISKMKNFTTPCSICRQVMLEFCDKSTEILMANVNREFISVSIEDLVPYQFGIREINNV